MLRANLLGIPKMERPGPMIFAAMLKAGNEAGWRVDLFYCGAVIHDWGMIAEVWITQYCISLRRDNLAK